MSSRCRYLRDRLLLRPPRRFRPSKLPYQAADAMSQLRFRQATKTASTTTRAHFQSTILRNNNHNIILRVPEQSRSTTKVTMHAKIILFSVFALTLFAGALCAGKFNRKVQVDSGTIIIDVDELTQLHREIRLSQEACKCRAPAERASAKPEPRGGSSGARM